MIHPFLGAFPQREMGDEAQDSKEKAERVHTKGLPLVQRASA